MEVEDTLDVYEDEDELAEEFGKPSVIRRAKILGKRKVAELKEKAGEEAEYQSFKHPTASYLKTGVEGVDPDKREKFAERLAREKEQASVKRVARRERLGRARQKFKRVAKPMVEKGVAFAKKEIEKAKVKQKAMPRESRSIDPLGGMMGSSGSGELIQPFGGMGKPMNVLGGMGKPMNVLGGGKVINPFGVSKTTKKTKKKPRDLYRLF